MKATINDVAKRAGVSMKTVSRVLNKEPNVAVKTRERVEQIARELNYTPNFAARGLASSKSYLLALMYGSPTPNYIMEIQRGAIDVCREYGYHLVLEPVAMPKSEASEILTKELESRLQHLPVIQGNPNHGSSFLRLEGFQDAINKYDLIVPKSRIVQGDYSFQSGLAAANALLAEPNARPTAIFASNDDMAAGVVSVANRHGINVPSSLSVCGFDDTPMARKISPQLSSVCQPIYEMGHIAVKMLLAREGDDFPIVQAVDYKLVFRGSTARCLT